MGLRIFLPTILYSPANLPPARGGNPAHPEAGPVAPDSQVLTDVYMRLLPPSLGGEGGWPGRPAACAKHCRSGRNQVLMGTKKVVSTAGPQKGFLREGRSQLGLEEFSQERMAG